MSHSHRQILGVTTLVVVGSLLLGGCAGSSDGGGTTGVAGAAGGTGGAAGGTGGAAGGTGGAGGLGGRGGTSGGGATGSGGAGGTGTGGGGSATPSTGCGKPATLTSGMASIDVSGTTRQYILKLPDNYDQNKPYKLIFGFHWLGGSMTDVASGAIIGGPYYGLQSRSAGSAILVAPDGLAANGGSKGWPNTNGQDVAFVKAMVALFESSLCIDQSRIFSTGFSYGGIFSLTLGCRMSDVFRAIAPMSGEFFGSCTASNGHAVAVWQAQGASDTTVDPAAAKSANDYFVSRNHCSMQTISVAPSPCVAYQGCDPGYPVTWCEFAGGHMPWNMAPDPVWAFLNQF